MFEPGRNGRGVRMTVNDRSHRNGVSFGISYDDAAHALFALKDFLRASPTGRRVVDDVAAERRAADGRS